MPSSQIPCRPLVGCDGDGVGQVFLVSLFVVDGEHTIMDIGFERLSKLLQHRDGVCGVVHVQDDFVGGCVDGIGKINQFLVDALEMEKGDGGAGVVFQHLFDALFLAVAENVTNFFLPKIIANILFWRSLLKAVKRSRYKPSP